MRRRVAIGAIAVSLVIIGGFLGAAFAWPSTPVVAPTVVPPSALPAADAAAYAALSPKLRAATVQVAKLVELGEERSRNLFAIRAAQREMEAQFVAVEALTAAPLPARFAPAIARYQTGAATTREAMSEAEAAFLRFDWERVARATVMLNQGTTELEGASELLDEAVGAVVQPNSTPTTARFPGP